jgi:hypothetical protein
MTTIDYRNLGGDTVASPGEVPRMLEAEEGLGFQNNGSGEVYDDRASKHNPTIGYGINLTNTSYLELVLSQILLPGPTGVSVNVFTDENATTQTAIDFVAAGFTNIIGNFYNPNAGSAEITNAGVLENALSNYLDSFFGIPPLASGNTDFQLSQPEAATVVQDIVSGYTLGTQCPHSIVS